MSSQSSLKCAFEHCEESCDAGKAMAHHVAREHRQWKCVEPDCPFKVIEGYGNLIDHVHEKHPDVGPISCPMCEYEQKPDKKKKENGEHFADWCRHATQKHLDSESANNRRSSRGRGSPSGEADNDLEASASPEVSLDKNENEVNADKDGDKSPASVAEDDDKSPASDVGGTRPDNGEAEIFACPICFHKSDRVDQHLSHQKNAHKTRQGEAECEVCKVDVKVTEIAKHGLQKHSKEFFIHCHFCTKKMAYDALIMHAFVCSERPVELDNATLLRALAEGRVPEFLSGTKGG